MRSSQCGLAYLLNKKDIEKKDLTFGGKKEHYGIIIKMKKKYLTYNDISLSNLC